MDADTATQFRLLRELAKLFGQARMRFWLRGGWALDFWLGKTTRPHSDIDIVSWSRHATRIRQLLEAHDYRVVRVTDSAAIHFSKYDQDVGVAFIVGDKQGRTVTPGREFWPWPDGTFRDRRRSLRGVACRVMSVESLLEEKEGYERHTRRPLRVKDLESIRILRSLL